MLEKNERLCDMCNSVLNRETDQYVTVMGEMEEICICAKCIVACADTIKKCNKNYNQEVNKK